jgi:hypothetical protein
MKHPHANGTLRVDNGRLEQLITSYQSGTDRVSALSEIVTLTQQRALTLIRFHRTSRYRTESELLSDIHFKLMRALDRFDPSKGSGFTFVSCVIKNTLCTAVTMSRRQRATYIRMRPSIVRQLVCKTEDRSGVDDIAHKIKSAVRTTLTDQIELSAQRWFVESFLSDGFDSRRHECANAAMSVHNLGHDRSRELYDLTMLEVRRVLFDDLPPRRPIAPQQLRGTRCGWLARYAHLIDAGELTKVVTLVHDLSPFVIVLIDPNNHNRRQDRSGEVTRANVEWVLRGHPSAVTLFM